MNISVAAATVTGIATGPGWVVLLSFGLVMINYMASQSVDSSQEGGNPSPYHKPHHSPQSRQHAEATTDSILDGGRGNWKDQQQPHATPRKTLSGHTL